METRAELEGTTLGRYLLQSRLARGGMSEVYLADDQYMQRTVAVKVVNRHQDVHRQRMEREVKALEMLSHRHILPIFDEGEQGPWRYFVMPYIKHGTLRERLARGPLTQEEAGSILAQVASALQCAHEHGILHCDIKPANILFDHENRLYLVDFGLAQEVGEVGNLTQTEDIIGTPEYMAPEMAEGFASPSSDIYALGIVLYQMLTGRVPFKGSTPIGVCWKHMREQPLRPSLLNPTIAQPIEQVILRALEKDPERRFSTVQAMVQAYNQAISSSQFTYTLELAAPSVRFIKAGTRPAWSSSLHGRRRVHRVGALLAAAVLFATIPFSLGFLISHQDLQPQTLTAAAVGITFATTPGPAQEVASHAKPIPIIHTSGHGHGNTGTRDNGSGSEGKHEHKHKHKHHD